MSHTTIHKGDYRCVPALETVCTRLGGKWLGFGTHELYEGDQVGWGVQLPGWDYPVVFKVDGSIASDNFNGIWGDEELLTKFKQYYPGEAARATYGARIVGFNETVLADGSVEVEITLADSGGSPTEGGPQYGSTKLG